MAVNRQDYAAILEQSASRVPYWARSTNPIVRRHLGLNWRTVPPELRPILTGVLIWSGIFGVGILLPIIHMTAAILVISSILILPIIGVLYLHILVTIAITTADAMQEELRNNTLPLLRATPMSLEQIFLGKIAVALWKRMDDLMLVMQAVLIFMPPLLLSFYTSYWPLDDYPIVSQAIILIGFITFLLRIILEPMFVGVLSVLIGAIVPSRNTAITTTLALSTFYFGLSFMVSRLPTIRGEILPNRVVIPPSLELVFLFDFVLPVAIPAVLTLLLLKLAVRIVTSD